MRNLSKLVYAELWLRAALLRKRSGSVAIFRVDGLGDFVLFRPSLPYYRKLFVDRHIILVTTDVNAQLIEREQLVDQVVLLDRKRFISDPFYKRTFILQLQTLGPDIAIYPAYTRVGGVDRMIYTCGARQRIAFRCKGRSNDWRRILRNSLYTRLLEPEAGVHHDADRNREFLQKLGVAVPTYDLTLVPGEENRQYARKIMERLPSGCPLVAIAPSASEPRRVWPLDHFISVASRLANDLNCVFVIIGSAAEMPLGNQITTALSGRCVNLMGIASVLQTYAVLERCALYLGNDTGPMHFAAAAGVAVVEISCHPRGGDPGHINSPVRFGAYGVRQCILQPKPLAPCGTFCRAGNAHCITQISPEEVFHGATELLLGQDRENMIN